MNWTILSFNYESNPAKQEINRKETRKRAGGLRGSRANGTDAHEVAYAMTKQGGNNSNTIMELVPSGENRRHGASVMNAVQTARSGDGDPLFVILVPMAPEPKEHPVPVPAPSGFPVGVPLDQLERMLKDGKMQRHPRTRGGHVFSSLGILIKELFKLEKEPFIPVSPVPAPVPIPLIP